MNTTQLRSSSPAPQCRLIGTPARLLLATIAIATLLFGCGGGTDVGPGRTEMVAGALYYEDGAPAENVPVRFVKMKEVELPQQPSVRFAKTDNEEYQTVTGKDGTIYLKDTLDDGYYWVHGGKDKLQSSSDSVEFKNGSCLDTLSDTLKKTGSITGKLLMRYENHDPKSIMMLVPGFGYYIIDKSDGEFTLENLPAGELFVRFIPLTDDYQYYDTTFIIKAGIDDTLTTPIEMPYVGSLRIQNVCTEIDTLRRSVRITWDELPDERVFGYHIETQSFRRNLKQPPVARVLDDSLPEAITCYLEDSLLVRIRPVDLNGDMCGDFTVRLMVSSPNLCSLRTVYAPVDDVGAHGLALSGDTLLVLASLYYGYENAVVKKILTDGTLASVVTLNEGIVAPVDIAHTPNGCYILDRASVDTLCMHLFTGDTGAVQCLAKLPLVNPPERVNISHLSITPDGKMFVTADQTLYRLDASGAVHKLVSPILPYFATSEDGVYGFSKNKQFELMHMDSNLTELRSIRFEDTTVYKNIDCIIRSVEVKNGVACVLNEQSLYIFSTEIRNVVRINIYDWNIVADMKLSDDNKLYILYSNGQIDRVDLPGVIDRLY